MIEDIIAIPIGKALIKCEYCGKPKLVRTADIKRGWGKFCSKSCAKLKNNNRKVYQ